MTQTSFATDLVALLQSRGWSRESFGEAGSIWRSPAKSVSVAVPRGLTVSSYEAADVLRRVSAALELDQKTVLELVRDRFVDVANFRAGVDSHSGSVPLETGAALVESARAVVRASATASRTPRLSINGKYSAIGDQLAAAARMGHTREGSFIVPILMPLPRPVADPKTPTLMNLDDVVQSDARRATRTLAQAVVALKTQVIEPDSPPNSEALGRLRLAGTSREIVEAIERVLRSQDVDSFSTEFRWATGLPAPTFLPSEVEIPRAAADLLKESAKRMRLAPRTTEEQLTGVIVEMRDEREPWAEFSLQTVRRGRTCEVRVRVVDELVQLAHQWFRDHDLLLVAGRVLSDPGKPLRVPSPTRVQRVADTQIFH